VLYLIVIWGIHKGIFIADR